ncbi:hypothetical protein DFP72DRAFT_530119 [Ephemerocybe angulata]|uniref:Uncharacterized protein n=1 Tax=Ephemerocybe angulata TaxID=980116 RepID=A0A8H6IFH0_9AGAR|nr:hypothetical protein DFP72DRAFT_530119 [Tulosesus angulatus]
MGLLITSTAMSTRPPPLAAISRVHKDRFQRPENAYPAPSSWSKRSTMPMARSSSPPLSSSPPRTTYSARDSDSYAFIHNSSPTIGHGIDLPAFQRHSEDPMPWEYKATRPYKPTHHFDISEARYPQYDAYDIPPSSELEIDYTVDDADVSLPEIDSETTSESSPGHGSIYFSDSEEDMAQDDSAEDDGVFSFGYSTLRSTCFRVSSERGQWKNDPTALKPSATANLSSIRRLRQSVPTPSRQPSENLPAASRPVSEPLPADIPNEKVLVEEPTHDDADGQELSEEVLAPSSPSVPHSDRPITPEPQALPEYSSPLPPSSPLLSPMSGCVSSMSRSVSPLSLPPSSPSFMPMEDLLLDEDVEPLDSNVNVKSAVSFLSSSSSLAVDDDDHSMPIDLESAPEEPVVEPLIPEAAPAPVSKADDVDAATVDAEQLIVVNPPRKTIDIIAPSPSLAEAPTLHQITKAKSAASSVASGSSSRALSPDENLAVEKRPPQKPRVREEGGKPLREQVHNSEVLTAAHSKPEGKKKGKKQVVQGSAASGLASSSGSLSSKRKAEGGEGSDGVVPAKKRKQGTSTSGTGGDNIASSSTAKASKKSSAARHETDDEDADDALPQPPSKSTSAKSRKRRAEKDLKEPRVSQPKKRSQQAFALESPQKGGEQSQVVVEEEGDAEMKGMIIECMATSRASSMPVSLVARTVMQAHPRLKAEKTEKEWRRVIGRVLVNGMAGRGSGVFGKVDSSGKDDSDRPLEAQWFYVPEMDEDQDRAALIRSMMPRPGKRSVTKQYKQYYWRPLDKISRWDPEDEL